MPKVNLPGGRSAKIGLRMAEFRQLWQSGTIKKLQEMGQEGSDLGDLYPMMALGVREWDVTDEQGNPLDPGDVRSYDELTPGTFMALMTAMARYVGGEDSKN